MLSESSPKCDLDRVLSYRHDDVVHRFANEYGLSLTDAEDVFLETKRWLWVCARRKLAVDRGDVKFVTFPLFNEARIIDSMWHTFLLYTEDYADFCDEYFGFFVHHKPRARHDREAWQARIAADPEGARLEREAELRVAYEALYDEVGEAVLVKWCEHYPRLLPENR